MTINLQNCINRQAEIDAHREFWKRPEEELIQILENWLDDATKVVATLSAKPILCNVEMKELEYHRKFIEIAQA